jgi:GT2 family glycosyltransferase
VIVVDNASTDGTRDYLLELKNGHSNIKVILNEENLGFAKANNMGIRASGGEYIILLNNDTVVTRGWISELIKYFKDPLVGMVGPVTNSIGNEAKINVNYKNLSEMEPFAESFTAKNRGKTFEISVLALYCAALSRKAIDKVGLLDEQFLVGMFEDDDYALRLKKEGFKMICAEDVFIHHFGGATLSRLQPNEYQRIFEENKRRYEQKWGIDWQPHKYRDGVV